jgi:hypothetical protein
MHQEKDCALVAHIKNQSKHHHLLLKNKKVWQRKKHLKSGKFRTK